MSMQYIRDYYGVPAKRGGRVEYGPFDQKIKGTITGARGAHLRIRLDGFKHSANYHPTYCLTYLKSTLPLQARGARL